MYSYEIYQIAFVALTILVSLLIVFLSWKYRVHRRRQLTAMHKGSALILLRTKSSQGYDCTSSMRIRKVDGRKADSFLYRWPWKYGVYVRPGVHRMEVRADWPIRTWNDTGIWHHYAVETLPEVTVEADTVYALDYEVKTDTWTLLCIGKDGEISGKESVSGKFVKPEGYISDNHLWVWNTVLLILWILGILFMKYA